MIRDARLQKNVGPAAREERAMKAQQRHPSADASVPQQTPGELAERIRKLRWLGMQDEAERLQLRLVRVPHTDCVMVLPADTD
jgi:hypothetical protein